MSLWLIIAALTAAAIGVITAFWAESVAFAMLFVVVLIGAVALHGRMGLGAFSPISVLVFLYLTLAVTGPLVAGTVAAGQGVSAQISLSLLATQGAYLVFVTAAGATVVGALLYSIARPPQTPQSELLPAGTLGSHRVRMIAAIFSITPLGLEVAAHGAGLLYRTEYIPFSDAGNPIVAAAHTLALPAIAVLGWLTQVSVTRIGKFLSYSMLVLYSLVLFALGTRTLALLPVMAALGMLAARPNSARTRAIMLFATVAGVLLLQVPLALRTSPYHGLLPYFQTLSHGIGTFNAPAVASNVLFAFQLTGQVAFVAPPLSLDTLWISLDPRPGASVGWYDIAPDLRINFYTPYNALGELANHGWLALAAFFVVVGAYFGHLSGQVKRLLSLGQGLAGLILFGLACLFIVLTLQYNLRSSVRILYYTLAFELAISLVRVIARYAMARRRQPPVPALRLILQRIGMETDAITSQLP